MERPCLRPHWLSVSHVRRPFGFSYNTLHQLYTVCVDSIPQIKPSTTPSHQVGPRVKWLRSPSLVRFTTCERPWDAFLHFLNTVYDRVWPLLRDVISLIPSDLEDALCFTVSIKLSKNDTTLNYMQPSPLQSPLSVAVQPNLQCSILKCTTL